jgi:peroxiredoxin
MIQVGDRIPDAMLYRMSTDGPTAVSTAAAFGGKRVALFGLPGAYTPTCHREHLPGYVERATELRAKGVDEIACVSVNDPFVLEAWSRDLGAAGSVSMLSDSDGGELALVQLDQVLGLAAGAVDSFVEMAGLAAERGDDVAGVEAARGRLQPGDDTAFALPGSGGVGEGGEAPHPVRGGLGAA